MRLALLAHLRHPIRPPFMGGMEAHSWHLARALAARGHEVTLFASADSADGLPEGVRLEPVLDVHYDRDFPWHEHHGTDALNAHLDAAFARVCERLAEGRFDAIHNNALHRYPPRLARALRLPMVTSLHVPPFPALHRAVTESAAPWTRFTVTSRMQVSRWWPEGTPEEARVVHNGIDLDLWPFCPQGDGSAVWAGRITPTKGPHLAAEAARLAGVPLRVYGTIEHADYFRDALQPLLKGPVSYEGHLSGATLAKSMKGASAALFTPLWDEPFGLAAIEAMALGLPVAAIGNGAAAEVIGPAGAIAATEEPAALAEALIAAMDVPRRVARERAERLFGLEVMVGRYEALYREVRAGLGAPADPVAFPAHAMPPLSATPEPALSGEAAGAS